MAASLVPRAALSALQAIERVSSRCIRILGHNPGPFTLQGTNTYLLGTGPSRVLVDTGQGAAAYVGALRSVLAAEQCIELAAVLLTHHHADHIGGIADVCALVPVRGVYKHALAGGEGDALDGAAHGAAHADDAEAGLAEASAGAAAGVAVSPLKDGDTFRVSGATLHTLHTPGHTSDHCAFLVEEDGCVLAGDTILGEGTSVFTDLAAYVASLRRIADVPGLTRILPGHGPVVDDGPARVRLYLQHRAARDAQILEQLAGAGAALRAADVVRALYVGYPAATMAAAERVVRLHLAKLVREGQVLRVPGTDEYVIASKASL